MMAAPSGLELTRVSRSGMSWADELDDELDEGTYVANWFEPQNARDPKVAVEANQNDAVMEHSLVMAAPIINMQAVQEHSLVMAAPIINMQPVGVQEELSFAVLTAPMIMMHKSESERSVSTTISLSSQSKEDMSGRSPTHEKLKHKLRNRSLRKDEFGRMSSQSGTSVDSSTAASDIVEGLEVLDWASEVSFNTALSDTSGDGWPEVVSNDAMVAGPPGNFKLKNRPLRQEEMRRSEQVQVPSAAVNQRMHWQQQRFDRIVSQGSTGHDTGNCKPCLFVSSPFGCVSGVECGFCHFRHNRSDKPRPSKLKRERFKKYQEKMFSKLDVPALGDESVANGGSW